VQKLPEMGSDNWERTFTTSDRHKVCSLSTYLVYDSKTWLTKMKLREFELKSA